MTKRISQSTSGIAIPCDCNVKGACSRAGGSSIGSDKSTVIAALKATTGTSGTTGLTVSVNLASQYTIYRYEPTNKFGLILGIKP